MFTGIIEGLGTVYRKERGKEGSAILSIRSPMSLSDVVLGDSIAVNGVCLTVTAIRGDTFSADISGETIAKTTFPTLKNGDKVNLEKALKAGGRLGGHIVTGHVDGTGLVGLFDKRKGDLSITLDQQLMKNIVSKGSVAINGVSLTVAEVKKDGFSVALISFTIDNTNITLLKNGDSVNIECDTLGKYVTKFLDSDEVDNKQAKGVTKDLLIGNGYIR